MARKLAHKRTSREPTPPDDCQRSGLTRRTYARLVATVATSVATLGGWFGTVAGDRPVDEHRIRIHGSGTASIYELTVEGELMPGAGASKDAGSCISGCTAEGAVTTGERRYRFNGKLRDVRVNGTASVSLNGVIIKS